MNTQCHLVLVAVFAVAIASCGSPPKPPVAEAVAPSAPVVVSSAAPVASARSTDPCETAKTLRARVPSLQQQGKLDRTVRVIRRADELCPSQKTESASVLAATLAELDSAPANGPALIAAGLDARKAGKAADAQRLFDRGIAQLEKSTGAKAAIGTPDGFIDDIGAVAWSSDNNIALAAGSHIHVLAASTLQERLRLEGDAKGVAMLAFSTDGRRLTDGTRVWELAEGKPLPAGDSSIDWPGGARQVSFDASGVRVTERASGRQLAKLAIPKGDEVVSTALSADGKKLATIGMRVIRYWDAASGRALGKLERSDSMFCNFMSATFSPDSKRIGVIESERHGVSANAPCWAVGVVRDVATGKTLASVSSDSDATNITAMAFSPDGAKLLTAAVRDTSFGSGKGSFLDVWNATSGDNLAKVGRTTLPVDSVVFSPDGGTIALTQSNINNASLARVVLWGLAPGKGMVSFLGLPPVVFSPDGTKLVCSGTQKATQILVDVATRKELARLNSAPPVFTPSTATPPYKAELEPADDKVFGTPVSHGVVLRTATGAQLAVVRLVGSEAGYVVTPDGYLELVGEAARKAAICTIGAFSFPIEVCEERFVVPGLLSKVVAGERGYGEP